MLDSVMLHLAGGTGGDGAVSFRREKFAPNGGPDGGDGGRGGRIYLRAVEDVYTLEQYRAQQRFRARDGGSGGPSNRHGSMGQDLVLTVPAGTVVLDPETDEVIADLTTPGQEELIARGGRGGMGNKRFATSTNQAPAFAQIGHVGEEFDVRLELRMLADVGFIGLPNAGKSTLLSAISNAKPKIAAYPFTTLEPLLGVVEVGWDRFTVADLPGLIEGASEGYGLGFEFLKHVRRCRVLVHLVDSSSPDPITDYELIEEEIRAYEERLTDVPRYLAVTKADIVPEIADEQAALLAKHTGKPVLAISGQAELNLDVLKRDLMAAVAEAREQEVLAAQEADDEEVLLRPEPDERFVVVQEDFDRYRVIGTSPVMFVEMMRVEDEASRFEIYRRMDRWGVSKALTRAGCKSGDTVVFGEVELEWGE